MFLTGEQRSDLTRRHPTAFAAPADATDRRIVVLALIEGTPHGYLRLVDPTAMLVSPDYIPADSSHELTMSRALIDAHRAFTKPLRYDRRDAVFPDFVLTDTGPPTVIEVWGITGRADYENRKHTKQAHYAGTERFTLVEWTPPAPLPDLQLP